VSTCIGGKESSARSGLRSVVSGVELPSAWRQTGRNNWGCGEGSRCSAEGEIRGKRVCSGSLTWNGRESGAGSFWQSGQGELNAGGKDVWAEGRKTREVKGADDRGASGQGSALVKGEGGGGRRERSMFVDAVDGGIVLKESKSETILRESQSTNWRVEHGGVERVTAGVGAGS
jgi:hypothetical protein